MLCLLQIQVHDTSEGWSTSSTPSYTQKCQFGGQCSICIPLCWLGMATEGKKTHCSFMGICAPCCREHGSFCGRRHIFFERGECKFRCPPEIWALRRFHSPELNANS